MAFTIDQFLEAKRLGLPYTGKKGTPQTLRAYKMALQRTERLVGKPLTKFDSRDAEVFLTEAEAQALSPASRNQSITSARSAFEWAIANGKYKGVNPFRAVKAQSMPQKLPRVLKHEDVLRLLDAIEEAERERREQVLAASHENTRNFGWVAEDTAEKYGLFFRVMYFGGLRIGEVLGLQKDDVLEDGVRVTGKGAKERFVPLPAELLTRLRSYIAEHPYTDFVFYGEAGRSFGVDTGKPMKGNKAYAAFAAGLKRAGLPSELTPHSLRHSFATHALSRTKRLEVVQDFLGHANPATTRIYAQVARDELKSEYGKLF